MDVRHSGIGDAVVACWVVHSARAVNRLVQISAGNLVPVTTLLSVPSACVLPDEDIVGAMRPNLGHFERAPDRAGRPMSGFDVLCRNLGLSRLMPVRPPYFEAEADGDWADAQWRSIDPDASRPRVLVFPEAAWPLRVWPLAYFIDLANELMRLGYAVAALSGSQNGVRHMPCHWWGGFTVAQAAAMCRRAHLVVANESGPAHLAAAVGAPAVAICGATDPNIIFGHEPNVHGIRMDAATLPCVGCHFSAERGYRHACDVGGCQALMRLDPTRVTGDVCRVLDIVAIRERVSCK